MPDTVDDVGLQRQELLDARYDPAGEPRSSQEQPRRSQEQPKSSPGEAQRQPSTYFWPEGGGPKVKKLRLGSIFTKSLGQQYTEIC